MVIRRVRRQAGHKLSAVALRCVILRYLLHFLLEYVTIYLTMQEEMHEEGIIL